MSSLIPKGFHRLPISRYFCGLLITVPLAVSLFDVKFIFSLSYDPYISQWSQYWRFAVFQLAFVNASQVLLTICLLHFALKNIERFFGSYKFFTILIVSLVYNSSATYLLSLFAFKVLGYNLQTSPGPIGLVFSLMYPYFSLTPSVYRFELQFQPDMKPVRLSDKFFIAFLSLQLLLSDGLVKSGVPAVIGYFIGGLISNDTIPGQNLNIPLLYTLGRYVNERRRKRNIEQELAARLGDENNRDATPPRPLGSQVLDTFRP